MQLELLPGEVEPSPMHFETDGVLRVPNKTARLKADLSLCQLLLRPMQSISPLDGGWLPRKENELDFLEALVTVWVAVIVDVTDAKAECKAATDREDEAKEPRPMEVNC